MEVLANQSSTDSSIIESFNSKNLCSNDLNDLMKRDHFSKTLRPHESFVYKLGYELAFNFVQSAENRSCLSDFDQTKFKFNLKKCHLCDFQSESRLVIDQHLAEPHTVKRIKCAFCDSFRTRSKQEYREHLFKIHNRTCKLENPPSKQMCSICNFECKNDSEKLNKHVHLNCQFRPINVEYNDLIRSQLDNAQAPTQADLLNYEFMFDLKQPSNISKLFTSKPSFFENKFSAYEAYAEFNDIKMYKSLIDENALLLNNENEMNQLRSNELVEIETNKLSKRTYIEISDNEHDNENLIKQRRTSSSSSSSSSTSMLNIVNSIARTDNIENSEEFENEKSFIQKYLSGSYKKEFEIDMSKMFELKFINGKCLKCNSLLKNYDLIEHLDKSHGLALSNLILKLSQCFLCGCKCDDRFELLKHQLIEHDLISFASTNKAFSFNDYTEKNKIYEFMESMSTNEKLFYNNKQIKTSQFCYNGHINVAKERCMICKEIFKSFYDLYKHVQNHLKTSSLNDLKNKKDLNNNQLNSRLDMLNSTDCSITSTELNQEKITKLKKCFFCEYNYYLNENYHKHLVENHVKPFNIHLKPLSESDLKAKAKAK